MANTARVFRTLLFGSVLLSASPAWPQGTHAQSVFGADPNLSDGAMALRLGDYDEGIRLTLVGLRSPVGRAHSMKTRSAAHSNLCAGYMMASQLRIAREHCDEALRIMRRNWRAYSNRAVLFVLTGQLKRAADDVERGKRINPNSRRLAEVEELLAARVAARGN
ncbi:MAG: hypothetical protein OXF03_08865 [Gammaproteobacteria bacterium]|nr:hypothetical protein [Gammaproteobacteria bacterium]MCY4341509.1 hypothetical protein [Gammaproteobacteria bacterium]